MLSSTAAKLFFMTTNAALLATVAVVGDAASIATLAGASLLGFGWGYFYLTEKAHKRTIELLESLSLLIRTEAAKAEEAGEQTHDLNSVDGRHRGSDDTKQ